MATGMMLVPEELDVFRVPHLRMKQLVNSYKSWVDDITVMSADDFTSMLQSLRDIFIEFKSHEHIENKLIIARLLEKMKESDCKSSYVCNCHKDNRVSEMMHLFADGVRAHSAEERINYGLMLSRELHKFTDSFLPHMKEEEEVFQPLLLQYFSYDELRRLKDEVIQQHSFDQSAALVEFYADVNTNEPTLSKASLNTDQSTRDNTLSKISRQSASPRLSCRILEANDFNYGYMDSQDCTSCNLCPNPCDSKCLDVFPSDNFEKDVHQSLTVSEIGSKSVTNSAQYSSISGCVEKTDVNISQCCKTSEKIRPVVKGIKSNSKNQNLCSSLKPADLNSFRLTADSSELPSLSSTGKSSNDEVWEENLQQHTGGLSIEQIPMETLLEIFQWLNVDDIGHCTRVCSSWAELSHHISLWRNCLPTQWARGCWKRYECDDIHEDVARTNRSFVDVEELHIQKAEQDRKLVDLTNSLIDHILPSVGHGVQMLVLNNSAAITDNMVQIFLELCPNLLHLDLSVTDISDMAFSKIRVEDIEASCDNNKVSRSYRLQYLNVAGCVLLTDAAIGFLCPDNSTTSLSSVNLSGCFGITSEGLWRLARSSPLLKPPCLYYCDNIVDGPFPNDANGCSNLEQNSDRHVCCRTGQ